MSFKDDISEAKLKQYNYITKANEDFADDIIESNKECWSCGTAIPVGKKYCEMHCGHPADEFDEFTGKCGSCGYTLNVNMMMAMAESKASEAQLMREVQDGFEFSVIDHGSFGMHSPDVKFLEVAIFTPNGNSQSQGYMTQENVDKLLSVFKRDPLEAFRSIGGESKASEGRFRVADQGEMTIYDTLEEARVHAEISGSPIWDMDKKEFTWVEEGLKASETHIWGAWFSDNFKEVYTMDQSGTYRCKHCDAWFDMYMYSQETAKYHLAGHGIVIGESKASEFKPEDQGKMAKITGGVSGGMDGENWYYIGKTGRIASVGIFSDDAEIEIDGKRKFFKAGDFEIITESKASEVNGDYIVNGIVVGKVTDFEPNNWFGKVELSAMPEFAEYGDLDPQAVVKGDDGVTYKSPRSGHGTSFDNDGNPIVDVTSYESKASESNGYIAFYDGQQTEIYADTSYDAQQKAIDFFNPPESKKHTVTVMIAEQDGKQVTHTFTEGFIKASESEDVTLYDGIGDPNGVGYWWDFELPIDDVKHEQLSSILGIDQYKAWGFLTKSEQDRLSNYKLNNVISNEGFIKDMNLNKDSLRNYDLDSLINMWKDAQAYYQNPDNTWEDEDAEFYDELAVVINEKKAQTGESKANEYLDLDYPISGFDWNHNDGEPIFTCKHCNKELVDDSMEGMKNHLKEHGITGDINESKAGESITDDEKDEVFQYLFDLQESGATNMFGSGAYVETYFPYLDKKVIDDVISEWMSNWDSIAKRMGIE